MSLESTEAPPVYTIREPAPADSDVVLLQSQLDALGGFSGNLRRLRLIWAPDCMVTVDGQARAQYVYPLHVETQVKMITEVCENGDRINHMLPYDEEKWYDGLSEEAAAAFRKRMEGKIPAIRNYIVERAVCAWIIQALVPPRITHKSRNDDELDVSNGAYELAHWCTSDGTEFGDYRPAVENDVEAVRALWKEREAAMKHRHDDDAAPAFWRNESRKRFRRMKARRDAALATQREQLKDRVRFFVRQLAGSVDVEERDGRPVLRGRGENRLISIPRVVLPKEIVSK